jgi:hypothetical protein
MRNSLKSIVLLLGLFQAFSCQKAIHAKLSDEKNAVNFLPGPCPYDCHDTRCQAYLNGYCGPGTTTPPDQLPTAIFISLVGSIHNNGLTFIYNNTNLTWTNGTTYANTCMNAIASYYTNQEGGMTIPHRTDITNFDASIGNNIDHWADGHAEDSMIVALIAQIAPTRVTNEKNLLLSALNIYHFNTTGMTYDQIFDTVIARANAIQVQYNGIQWAANTGGCIGGYLQIVINSAIYWQYVSDYGVIPPVGTGGGGNSIAHLTQESTIPYLVQPPFWLKLFRVATIQIDAGGYLWGWGKSYFGGEPSENKRISTGLSSALEASSMGLIK